MHEERAMIIRMIEEGKITAEQGLALLDALEQSQTQPQSQAAPTLEHNQEEIQDADQEIEQSDHGQAANWTSTFDASRIERMEFSAHEGSIKYETWDEAYTEVKATYKEHNGWSTRALNEWLNKSIIVSHGEEQYIWSIAPWDNQRDRELENELVVTIRVPHEQSFEQFKASTHNGTIKIDKLLSESAEITTHNGTIKLNDVKLEELKSKSTNGAIKLESGVMETAELTTTNGKILVSGTYEGLTCHTINGKIKLFDLIAEEVELHTQNGNIDADAVFEQMECKSQNGAISVQVRRSGETLERAATSNGSMLSELSVETHNGAVNIVYEEGVVGVCGEFVFSRGRARCVLNGETFADMHGDNDTQTIAFRQGDEEYHRVNVTTHNGAIQVETIPVKNLLPS
ncbi:DUF4097 family beta strand repeat-containing protein [Paenibacillus albus]|uniref:Uncharacterized protein n=1 Tax=Paenibacillus albus TaxID=2495582 RepID=A0A3Q8X4V6_9BACL|nr:DUF4097 family beta strand repeat-containing protein [Paenibacillus albus]AZN40559.1 hypothetical protein EJC50_13495 [Paenibacillus albus]